MDNEKNITSKRTHEKKKRKETFPRFSLSCLFLIFISWNSKLWGQSWNSHLLHLIDMAKLVYVFFSFLILLHTLSLVRMLAIFSNSKINSRIGYRINEFMESENVFIIPSRPISWRQWEVKKTICAQHRIFN